MSVKALLASFKAEGPLEERRLPSPLDDLDRNELAVARWLLWRHNDKTGECTPSDRDLAIGTGLSARSVERARKSLRDRGLISWRERRAAGKRGSNEYELTAILTVCSPEQPDNLSEQTDKSVGANRQNGAPQPDRLAEEQQHVEQLQNERKGEAAAAAAPSSFDQDLDQLVNRIYAMWDSEVFPDKLTPLTDARRRVIVARLDHYEPEEIEQAIRNREHSDWFSGRKPQDGRQRFDLTDLLASDETLEELRETQPVSTRFDFIGGMNQRAAENKRRAMYDTVVEEVHVDPPPPDRSYEEAVKAAVVITPLTPAQIFAEHAEAVECLRHAEDSCESKASPFRESAVESARAEVARLERDYRDVLGGEGVVA
jgi:hypothetical protein